MNNPRQKNQNPDISTRKQEEIIGILLLMTGILVLIALFTYEPGETPATITNPSLVKNGLGIAGVYVSHFLIRWTIGFPVFILPFFVIAWGLNRLFGRGTRDLLRWTGLTFLFAFLLSVSFALHDIISRSGSKPVFEFSGKLGGLGAQFLVLLFGQYGAVVVLIGIIMIMVLMSTTFSFADLYQLLSVVFTKLSLHFSRWARNLFKKPLHSESKRGPALVRPERPAYKQPETAPDEYIPPPPPKTEIVTRLRPEPVKEKTGILKEQLNLNLAEQENDAEEMPLKDEQYDPEEEKIPVSTKPYEMPPIELLHLPQDGEDYIDEEMLQANARLLEDKLSDFGITARVIEIHPGPVITRYELEPAPGIKVARITALSDDLAMAMRAKRIRIVAPIPGKAAVGVELPNANPSIVYLREILEAPEFKESKSPLTIAVGKTISGKPFITDLAKMPHLLVAGATGSGKSVCLNTIILSFLYKAKPSEVQMVMIDPKRLELSNYAKLFRHHLCYVEGAKEKVAITAKSAIALFKSIEQEMERRYEQLAGAGVRNIEEYNERIKEGVYKPENDENPKILPYMVVIVDELADLMLTTAASREVEEPIARLAQMSRAVGIHLILATQRPSVDVITGVIKANFPARMGFQVASKVDSRTILDMNGAEKLLGRGDMLFLPPASPELIRIHSAFVSLNEIESIIEHIRHQAPEDKKPLPAYSEEEEADRYGIEPGGKRDALFDEAMKLVVRHQQGSVSLIQRRLKVGYSRAARIIDELEEAGVVGPFEGSKAREVLLRPEDLESMPLNGDEDEEELEDEN
ncbi:MAG TPA: DNA translocase FtsK [bacterium]|nr:DNA translocase FtsK [bacterium]HPN42286.1 DNA translocase FtsK [bacterium]